MITVIGSLNFDLVARVPRFPAPGETLAGSAFQTAPGGKGANQAVALARMGASTRMLGAVGIDAFGPVLTDALAAAGVDTTEILRRDSVPTGNAIILINPGGQNQIVISAGANGTLSAEDIRERAALIRRSSAVVAQLETPLEATIEAFELARSHRILTVLNPAPARRLDDSVLQLCDWIVLNESEAAEICGVTVDSIADASAAARSLQSRAPGLQVVVTLGARGLWLEAEGASEHQPAFTVPVVDTVAAGDAFVGAFVAGLIEGRMPSEAARIANAAAALTVTRHGALDSIPLRTEVEAFLQSAAG